MYLDVICAGFGGQGVLFIGNLLARAAMEEGYNVTFLPVYGAEMRGGTANCTVVIADAPIGAPLVARPLALVAMNGPSLARFQPCLHPEGVQIVNSSLVEAGAVDPARRSVLVPLNAIADGQLKNPRLGNMVALGALLKATGCLDPAAVQKVLEQNALSRDASDRNREALEAGYLFAERQNSNFKTQGEPR